MTRCYEPVVYLEETHNCDRNLGHRGKHSTKWFVRTTHGVLVSVRLEWFDDDRHPA